MTPFASLVRHERIDSFAVGRLNSQGNAGRLTAVECDECSARTVVGLQRNELACRIDGLTP